MLRRGWVYSMNPILRKVLVRGMMFSGLGPIVLGIVYFILDLTGTEVVLTTGQLLLGIVTTYVIAFVHAGVGSLPHLVPSWSMVKSMFIQFVALYSVYTVGYLINNWIPFNPMIILTYTIIFVLGFFSIWLVALVTTKIAAKKLNQKLFDKKKEE